MSHRMPRRLRCLAESYQCKSDCLRASDQESCSACSGPLGRWACHWRHGLNKMDETSWALFNFCVWFQIAKFYNFFFVTIALALLSLYFLARFLRRLPRSSAIQWVTLNAHRFSVFLLNQYCVAYKASHASKRLQGCWLCWVTSHWSTRNP